MIIDKEMMKINRNNPDRPDISKQYVFVNLLKIEK